MKKYIIVITSLFTLINHAEPSNKKEITKEIELNETLKVELPSGDINVVFSEDKQVKLRVSGISLKYFSLKKIGGEVQVVFDMANYISEENTKSIKLEDAGSNFNQQEGGNNIVFIRNGRFMRSKTLEPQHTLVSNFVFSENIKVNIEVPQELNLSLGTRNGNIQMLRPVKGNVDVDVHVGSIRVSDVYGNFSAKAMGGEISTGTISGNANIYVETGNVESYDISGDAIIQINGGNVKLGNVMGKLDLKATNGFVSVKKTDKNSTINVSMGDIKIETANENLFASTNMGSILINSLNANSRLTAKSGSISLNDVKKNLLAQVEVGDIKVNLNSNTEQEQISLSSDNGNIELNLKQKMKANVSFSIGGNGILNTTLTKNFFSEKQGSFLVNGGGNTFIQLKTKDACLSIKYPDGYPSPNIFPVLSKASPAASSSVRPRITVSKFASALTSKVCPPEITNERKGKEGCA
ncbi:hypothetical protein CHS0354_024031 [Potamilus streckersoni]|uniref:DUF4097 domain-containing protein n=1 Tax=Potamilus streckersoni TaxID=2493646 RepID=A0AAE0RZU7_9BIVA|nr:hypothetical protein CHS0354_024031 [Potamilus streckersoni]